MFLQGNLSLDSKQVFVCFLELLSGLGHSLGTFEVSELLSFDLLLDVLLDEFTLQFLLLHLFDIAEFELL